MGITRVLPPGAYFASESEVNQLEPGIYFDGVAFDIEEGDCPHIVFSNKQGREDFVAELNGVEPRDMTNITNW